MKTRISAFVIVGLAALLQTAINNGQASGDRSGLPTNQTASAGPAVLSVSSGFATSPNPLAGRTMVLFKESFGAFLKRKEMFQGLPGSVVKQSPLAVWVYACQTGSPVCQQALYEARPNSISEAKMDANARATLPGVPPGTYFLFAVAGYNNQFLVWDLRVDLKPGTNSVVLDQRNTASLDADSARANAAGTPSKSGAESRPCSVSDASRTVKSGAPANSTLSVIGAGYVYTYTKTDRRTGAVVDSFTERGNFSDTTLYLLDDDADAILQRAGIQPGLLGSRLATLTLFDAGTQVENFPGMELMASILGHPEAMAEFTKEGEGRL
jgi:hypothetical protein